MQIQVLQETLKRGMAIVNRAVATKSALPILSNVLLEAKDGKLTLRATNLEIGISADVGAKVTVEGAITLPAKLLSDVVNGLPNEVVTLSLDERTQSVKLTCGRTESTLHGVEADEFPVIPSVPGAPQLSIAPDVLKEAIEQVAIAAATDDTRPVLAGVLLRVRGGTATFAAADGYRLAVKTISLPEPVNDPVGVIIPARALHELARALGGVEGNVDVAVTPSGGQVCFQTAGFEMISRLIEGNFPDYERIIPAQHATRTVLDTAALQKAVRLASYFATASANIVRLTMDAGNMEAGALTIAANTTEIGDNHSVIDAQVAGNGGQIAVNVKFLQDALATMKTPQVAIETQTPNTPAVLKPVGQDGFLTCIMPMTIR